MAHPPPAAAVRLVAGTRSPTGDVAGWPAGPGSAVAQRQISRRSDLRRAAGAQCGRCRVVGVSATTQGCVAVVTGGNRGIGRGFVEELLAGGAAKVYCGARDVADIPAEL